MIVNTTVYTAFCLQLRINYSLIRLLIIKKQEKRRVDIIMRLDQMAEYVDRYQKNIVHRFEYALAGH